MTAAPASSAAADAAANASLQPLPGKNSFLVCGTRFDVDPYYQLIKPIGHGAYGVVCSALNTQTTVKHAIKKITKVFANPLETKRVLREIRILTQFTHPNIIRIQDLCSPVSYSTFDDLYIVTDLMDTDLHQIITSNQPLTDEHIQYFIYQILRGLKYIHSTNVIHRDLKPSNLLLNANCDLKICDFGLARVAANDDSSEQSGFLTEYVATRWYRAPEIMLSWKEYTKAIDVWSVGCILGECLGRRPIFPGKDYMHQLHLIIDTLGTPSQADTEYIASEKAKQYIRNLPYRPRVKFEVLYPNASAVCIDLLSQMLHFNPDKRITVDQALQHPYFKLLHDPTDEPICTHPFDATFETEKIDLSYMKDDLYRCIRRFHPEMKDESSATAGAPIPQSQPVTA